MSRRAAVVGVIAAMALAIAGCGDDKKPVVVSAASSLETAFTAYADEAGIDAKQSFAGSDDLAAQIRQGVISDVYAAANTSLPDALFEEELVEQPVVFAGNSLVLAVPKGSKIDSIDDLAAAGTKVAIGDESVPIGSYTREVLSRLDAAQGSAILANVRSNEPDVGGIVGKLTQGAVDAGFVYVTDVTATGGELVAIELPSELQPVVSYGVAVVVGAENPDGAQEFIDGLLDGAGADALKTAGFLPPPS